ncbi:NAD(P)-dependent alcohol dehydrogenase [Streptomyces sp. NPDC001691]|uniref:NAD(P)-dependent alcohol dehydrogenase n=1 Tax=Streptomyces sp. NPDC001691 TaxID=3364600 RepID=UPI00368987C6
MRTTEAAILREPGQPCAWEQAELQDLAADEILVRMAGVGVCHTDLLAAAGTVPLPLPVVLGHEGAGTVEAVGPGVDTLCAGDEVILTFDSCGQCALCQAGHPAYCELSAALNYTGTRLDGSTTLRQGQHPLYGCWFGQSSFATHAVARVRNAVKVPARPGELPLELLGPLGCGLQTGAGTVFNVLRPQPGQSIAVFGLGPVGLSAVLAAAATGCGLVIGVEPNPHRAALARELGADHTIDPAATDDIDWAIADIASPGVDFTIDTVGSPPVVRQALTALRTPGVCATVGLQAMENDVTVDQGHLLMGRTLTGVIEGDADPHTFIPRLIELWQQGRFPFERLISQFPYNRINDAFEAARCGKVVKPLLVFD